MCGITGFLSASDRGAPDAENRLIETMMAAIAHRGPDSQGHWSDPSAGIALGHLRLAIVDLSAAGHQPMAAHSGRYVLSFNGEIYNHPDLRAAIEAEGRAPNWRGASDTETLLAGFDAWGIAATLARVEGMFAFALWDRETRELTLARDRLGEKPLYFGWQGSGPEAVLLFGSELHALRSHPACTDDVDRDSLVQFLRHGHVGGDRSILQGIHKLRPGEIATLSRDRPAPVRRLYWDGAAIAADTDRGAPPAPQAAVDELETLLLDAVDQQMMSDVPLGAFLSGGVDSSAIVALMQHLSDRPVHTFSIGFHEKRYNEADFAKAIATHLGTHHTELYVGQDDLLGVVPQLADIYDEPFADSSQIPTYLVARLAREHVTVALSGDGGDELFCGYDRYRHATQMTRLTGRMPTPLRRAGGRALRAVPAGAISRVLEPFRPTPQGKEPNGQRLHRLANYAMSRDLDEMHRKMVSLWRFPDSAVTRGTEPPHLLSGQLPPRGTLDDTGRLMQLDMLGYLPDDILTKVDRATMAVALESRAPLLDHRVAEFAWRLPTDLKLRDGRSKWVLREVLYRHVPRRLIERPKMGFEAPIGLWLRGPLRDWAAELLDPARLADEGYFRADVIARTWQQHLSGRFNWGQQLWAVLMFQAWRARPRPARP